MAQRPDECVSICRILKNASVVVAGIPEKLGESTVLDLALQHMGHEGHPPGKRDIAEAVKDLAPEVRLAISGDYKVDHLYHSVIFCPLRRHHASPTICSLALARQKRHAKPFQKSLAQKELRRKGENATGKMRQCLAACGQPVVAGLVLRHPYRRCQYRRGYDASPTRMAAPFASDLTQLWTAAVLPPAGNPS
ncbi:MAG: hypothetical protein PHW08_09905 [Kiritimatiellae bacterium]|nr:hypothetical protein [Kiritimatiellia bacterium]MDD4060995.1 hypothetical protein [Kiritimatiellia bacterium]